VIRDDDAQVLFRPRPQLTQREAERGMALLGERDYRLLSFLRRHRFMTRYQAERLFFDSPVQSKRRLKFLDKIRAINRLAVKCSTYFPPVYMLDITGARLVGLRNCWADVQDVNAICKYLQLTEIYIMLSPGIVSYRVRPRFNTHKGFYMPMAEFDYAGVGGRERKLIVDILRPGDDDLDRKLGHLCALLDEPSSHFEEFPAFVLNCCDERQIRVAARCLYEHARKVAFTTDDLLYEGDLNKAFLMWNGGNIEPIPDQEFFLPKKNSTNRVLTDS
jgi:hypothetical protein